LENIITRILDKLHVVVFDKGDPVIQAQVNGVIQSSGERVFDQKLKKIPRKAGF